MKILPFQLAAVGVALLVPACASREPLPKDNFVKNRGAGNVQLRLPSQIGSKPGSQSRWWDGGVTRYPNPGYYSSGQ